jgi:CubicO group peptidase (beta-lactamase class C family)
VRRDRKAALLLAAVVPFCLPPYTARANDAPAATIDPVVRASMATYHLEAVIVQVRENGRTVFSQGFGESMAGVPATAAMHFRNGAMAFTYMATLLLEMVDRKKVTLDTKLATYFPELPNAQKITLKNLANMTSGYGDYVYQSQTLQGTALYPFRQWTPEELIHIGLSAPRMFAPGTNWGYCHTNYVILGRVLEKITGMPLAQALQRYVLAPMGLTQTQAFTTPYIPEPVLHSFDSERRETLGVKAGVPFIEESTFWNPSWTTIEGAVETTDLTDESLSMEAVGTGKLLSRASSAAQIEPHLLGFGRTQAGCDACRPNTTAFSYGLGVMLVGPWIAQTLGFAGASGAVAYLRSQKLTISVEATNGALAFDEHGNPKVGLAANNVLIALANALAPNTMPKELK